MHHRFSIPIEDGPVSIRSLPGNNFKNCMIRDNVRHKHVLMINPEPPALYTFVLPASFVKLPPLP